MNKSSSNMTNRKFYAGEVHKIEKQLKDKEDER
jgi:hypothetical protein